MSNYSCNNPAHQGTDCSHKNSRNCDWGYDAPPNQACTCDYEHRPDLYCPMHGTHKATTKTASDDTHVDVTPEPEASKQDDYKLLIFGWITTILGMPPKLNPAKYHELTDKIYILLTTETNRAVLEELNLVLHKPESLNAPRWTHQNVKDRIKQLQEDQEEN